jgi:hypothetical protein
VSQPARIIAGQPSFIRALYQVAIDINPGDPL